MQNEQKSLGVCSVTFGKLAEEAPFNGFIGYDDIEEGGSLLVFIDESQSEIGYAYENGNGEYIVGGCVLGGLDDSDLGGFLPQVFKEKQSLILYGSINLDEAGEAGISHEVFYEDFNDEDPSRCFYIGDFLSDSSKAKNYLAVHKVYGFFVFDGECASKIPLDKLLNNEEFEPVTISSQELGIIEDFYSETDTIALLDLDWTPRPLRRKM